MPCRSRPCRRLLFTIFVVPKSRTMAQDAIKLFISHSSKTEQNLTLLKQVCDALAQQKFDVLVDKSGKIPEGEEWFRYLAEWMAECNAAIILFSRAAFEQSDWVRAEATILSWRKRIQPKFKLVGVLLDDVEPEEFDDDHFFKVIRISDFQFIRDFDSNDLALTVSEISQALDDLKNQELPAPFLELARLGRDILNNLKQEPLQDAWNALNSANKPIWQPGMDFGDALARMLLRDPSNALKNLHQLLKKLAHVLNKEQAHKLLEIFKGQWVNPEAAAELCWLRHNRQSVAINSSEAENFTGHCYARRAWCYPINYKLISAGTSRTLKEIDEVLLENFGKSNRRQAQRRLQSLKEPLLLVFPHSEGSDAYEHFPDETLLEQINATYPMATVLVETGSKVPNEITNYVTPLEPLLRQDVEYDQFDSYTEIDEFIDSQI
jgi:hypothetical protein